MLAPYTALMRTQRFDARRLDVEAFAKGAALLAGAWPAAELSRLMQSAPADCNPNELQPVHWQVAGELRRAQAADQQVWLRLKLDARLPLVCQRCLGAVDTSVHVDTSIRFVRGEEAAEHLDAEGNADVLALTTRLDLQTLAEDELILALPLVPRHERCPPGGADSSMRAEEAPGNAAVEHPFAALAALQRGPPAGR